MAAGFLASSGLVLLKISGPIADTAHDQNLVASAIDEIWRVTK